MKAAQITKYGESDVIEIRDIPQPEIDDNSMLVSVHAAGVNPADVKIRKGYLAGVAPLTFPATLGGDFAGVVVGVGKNVTEFLVNDEIYGSALVLGAGSGAFAEYAQVTPKTVAKKPVNASFKQSAGLPLAGTSALMALTEHLSLQAGQKILIHGGAGGIGSLAIQIAKHLGLYVISTTSATDMHFAKEMGADEVIDYSNQKFDEMVKDIDAVYDTVGGQTYQASFRVLKKGGTIVSMVEQPNNALMLEFGVTAISQFTKITAERLAKLTELVESAVVKVHIEKEFPLAQTAEALTYQETEHPKGKIILTIQ